MFISVLKVFLGREFRNCECFGRGSDFPDGVLDWHGKILDLGNSNVCVMFVFNKSSV